jgi:hypothetical protein
MHSPSRITATVKESCHSEVLGNSEDRHAGVVTIVTCDVPDAVRQAEGLDEYIDEISNEFHRPDPTKSYDAIHNLLDDMKGKGFDDIFPPEE